MATRTMKMPSVPFNLMVAAVYNNIKNRLILNFGESCMDRSLALKSRGSYGNSVHFLKRSQYISLDFYVLRKSQKAKCGS